MNNEYLELTKELNEQFVRSVKKRNLKNYFKEHWISIAALIISISSLCVSVYASNKSDNNTYYCYYQSDCRDENI